MKEYIEREAVLDAIKSALFDQQCDCEVMPEVFKRVQELEAANVAPVVRCRECKYFGHIICGENHACQNYQMPYCKPDDFCSRGEQRESPTCHDGVCEIPGVEQEEDDYVE